MGGLPVGHLKQDGTQHRPESSDYPVFFLFLLKSLSFVGYKASFLENYFGGYMIWYILFFL